MSRVFFISDPHFGHNSLCENIRGFNSKVNDELIIENWNKVVNKKDIVYILGDFCMEDHKIIEYYIKKLKGQIRIIGGNHDNLKCCNEFNRLGIPVLGCLKYKGFICTHIPVHPNELNGYFIGNIHGHIHDVDFMNNNLGDNYFNVNVEFINYKPILFDEIVDILEKRKKITNAKNY